MNWINATERKPDTTRKVFVRGIIVARHSRGEEEWLAVASWHEFDKRWSNINTIRPDDTARTAEPSHWAEITDILTSLDTAEPEGKAEIGVHGLIPKGCTVIEMLDWALETTLESIVYAESKIKWNEAQNMPDDDDTKWLESETKRYQRLWAAWERRVGNG